MQNYWYEWLSIQDNDFLLWETPALPMHGSGISIFSAGELATEDGGVDFASIKRLMGSILHHVPRYRQKIIWVPGEDRSVWVDDPQFHLDYHMRHIALPRPGTDAQLKRLAADIMERPLDRSRPLWETWVIEGLEDGRFAMIAKTHHCMIDGASGMSVMEHIYDITPRNEIREAPRFVPRPMPSESVLRRDSLRHRIGLPGRALRDLREFVSNTEDLGRELSGRAHTVRELAKLKLFPASDTPINGPIGPHRIFDWLELPLEDLKAVRRARNCSINDVVLATVTGAVRELMMVRQLQPEKLDFRVSAPVNVRSAADSERLGNHVSSWIVRLPLEQSDPLEQLRIINETTRELKESKQSAGVEMVKTLQEWVPIDVQGMSTGTQNMLVTNVPGPPMPLYLLGAEMESLFAQAPLIENIGLAVAALSYNGKVGWGFNADYDRLPDLSSFVKEIALSFERLSKAAESCPERDAEPAPSAGRPGA